MEEWTECWEERGETEYGVSGGEGKAEQGSCRLPPSWIKNLIIPTPSVLSWNFNSLSAHPNTISGIARNHNITSSCKSLQKISQIHCFQETHLCSTDNLALSTTYKKWLRLYNNAHKRRGTMMLIAPSILKHYHVEDISPTTISRGRVQVVNFTPKNVPEGASATPFKVINCYFPTGGRALNARRIPLFKAITELYEPMHTFLVGDMNFVEDVEDSSNPDGSSNQKLNSEAEEAWRELLDTYSLREVHQPVHTFVRIPDDASAPPHTARLDRVYISHPESDQTLYTPIAYLPAVKHTVITAHMDKREGKKNFYAAAPDHYPVALRFVSTAPSKKRDFNIPSWVGETAEFKRHCEANWATKAGRSNCPFENELDFKKQMISSAKALLRLPHNKRSTDQLSNLTRSISLFRMALSNNDYSDKMQAIAAGDPNLAKCLTVADGKVTVNYKRISAHITKLLADSRPREDADGKEVPQRPSRVTNIIKSIKAELPSTRKRLIFLQEEGREPDEDPHSMARELKSFWQVLWTCRSDMPSVSELELYLRRYNKVIQHDLIPQLPTLCHFIAAIEETNDSAAGRDGIPFSCYRALKQTAAPLLMDVFIALALGRKPLAGFNHGRLFMIPKDNSMRVDRLRPINVNNGDNRIMTTVQVVLITPAMQQLIDPCQKGFIPGRQGTDHVVDLNKVFYEGIRNKKDGFVLFLDTEKAFDSVDHQFIEAMLLKVGMPQWCINFTMALFDDVLVFPVLSERTDVYIEIGRGVKQGCPLSPLLFALSYDVLLVYLSDVDGIIVFAFADDLAAEGSREALANAMHIIDLFASITGLGINRDKTAILKTRVFTADDAAFFQASAWPDVVLAENQVYLGVLIGRRVDSFQVFEPALKKFVDRAALYRQVLLSRSIDHRIIIANVFLTTIFSYLTQFFIVPHDVISRVRDILRKLIIPFNGGAFAYVHLVTPTSAMGFKQPLRDLWAAGISALTAEVDFDIFNGMDHPPLLASKPYLNTNTWQSMHIEDHRDAAALDLLTFQGACDFSGKVQVNYSGSAKTKRTYLDALALGHDDDTISLKLATSLPSKLCRTWSLVGDYAIQLRGNAPGIGKWVPAHFRSNHIKLIFNALATDVKRDIHGGVGPELQARRDLHFPCYICGKPSDCSLHIFARCEVVRHARHVFLHRVGCLYKGILLLPEEVLTTGTYLIDHFPPILLSAIIVFNHAVWDHSRTYFRSLGEPPSLHSAADRIATYATSLWNQAAPKKLRTSWGNGDFFMPRLPATPVRVLTCPPNPRSHR